MMSLMGLLILIATRAHGQSLEFQVPGVSISAAEQLLIEQVEELNAAGEIDEAIRTLEQLFDACDGRIVEATSPQSARTLVTQNYIPVRQWIQSRLSRLLTANPAARTTYVADHRAAAIAALAESVANRDLVRARQLADRFSQTAAGVELRLLLADLYLERVWGVAAIQAARQLLPGQSLNNQEQAHVVTRGAGKADSPTATDGLQLEMRRWTERLSQESWQLGDPEKQAAEALYRVIDAAAICDNCTNRHWAFARTAAIAEALPAVKRSLLERLESRNDWQPTPPPRAEWSTFGGSSARHYVGKDRLDPGGWPTWNQTLERYNSSSDRTAASKPRVSELESGSLLYHPAIYHDRVFVNELNRISAYDLKSGKPWPEIEPPLPLFDSQISPASLMPLGYPMVGMPRGMVAIYDNCLYARLGSPVTAWASGQAAPDGGSLSYIVGLDLERQGSLLRGFPLRLSQFDFAGAEPEGCPLIIGDSLFVAVVKRDNVGSASLCRCLRSI